MEILPPENPFIPFTSDYGFKVTFGNESNTLFLRRALQALIGSKVSILEVAFDKNAFEGVTKDSRSGIFDLSCVDERGNHFIVEMQLGHFPAIYQRLQFYIFQKLNGQVHKGKFNFKDIPKMYGVAILRHKLDNEKEYHNVSQFKNQHNRVTTDVVTLVVVELEKFTKPAEACVSDLDKLLYTMKVLSEAQDGKLPTQYPAFWTEEWLQTAIQELDLRVMPPEKRLAYEMTLAANAYAIQQEQEKVEAARAEGEAIGEARARTEAEAEKHALKKEAEAEKYALKNEAEAEKYALKKEMVRQLLIRNFSDEDIVAFIHETPEFIQQIKAEIAEEEAKNDAA